MPPIPGLDSPRCVDSTGLLAQDQVPKRLVVLGGGIIGCEFASIFNRFGSEVTIIEMLDAHPAGGRGRERRSSRSSSGSAGSRSTSASSARRSRTTARSSPSTSATARRSRPTSCSSPSGARRSSRGSGSRPRASQFDKRKGIAADDHRRTSVPHIYAVGDCAGYWQLAHTAFREGEVAAENACGHDAIVDARAVPRPIYTDPEIAGVGLTEAQAREQYGDDVAVGLFPWVANARAVMQDETVGWVKSIHETRYGELLGIVMVGPHVTDLIEAGVVAIDAESTVETVADGMAAHPTLSEAIKEAGLAALGRAIHIPNRKPRAKAPA